MRELREGSKGRCLYCGYPIEVMSISTGRFHGILWRREWRHLSSMGRDMGRTCPGAPVATPRPHTKRVVV